MLLWAKAVGVALLIASVGFGGGIGVASVQLYLYPPSSSDWIVEKPPRQEAATMAIIARNNHGRIRVWPSLETATFISDLANWALVASLGVGVVATVLIVWMASVKESYWDDDRAASAERIAELNNETARLHAKALLVDDALRATTYAGKANALSAQKAMVVSELMAFRIGTTSHDMLSESARSFLIIQKIRSFAGKFFNAAVTISDDGWSSMFLASLTDALKAADWIEVEIPGAAGVQKLEQPQSRSGRAVLVSISVDATDNAGTLSAAQALASALTEEGIAAEINTKTDTDITNPNVIHIRVRPKPPGGG